ncbi:MAG: hypothetical protein K1X72_15350 [Pyrinomonadaceae bacterium]|nr:hypothetical protein [Pyrinomonadaceae bacterium]
MKKDFILSILLTVSIIFLVSCTVQNSNNIQNSQIAPKTTPTTPNQQVPKLEIKTSEAESLALNTVYRDFFPADSKCRKNYNELFGKEDGFYSEGSPCTLDISFNRDGSATKTIRLERWDKETKQKKEVEKTDWKAKISPEQFEELAKSIIETETFQNWNDNVMLDVANTRISVKSSKVTRTLLSNVDAKTTVFLKLMDSFNQLDGKIKWEKAV